MRRWSRNSIAERRIVPSISSETLVSCPRNTRYFVAIKMGRRPGGPSRTGGWREHIFSSQRFVAGPPSYLALSHWLFDLLYLWPVYTNLPKRIHRGAEGETATTLKRR